MISKQIINKEDEEGPILETVGVATAADSELNSYNLE